MPEDDVSPDPVLLVGAVTWDVVDGERRPGGAVTYAARAATALGVRAYVLAAADADADLEAFAAHELAVVRLEPTMTLEHRFEHGERRQRVAARPDRPLWPGDLPEGWPSSFRTVVLWPLLPDDIDVAGFLEAFPARETALLAQGLQRRVASDGTIEQQAYPTAATRDAVRPGVTLCFSAEETAGWPAIELDRFVARSKRVVRTLGADGAEIRTIAGTRHVPALEASVVDTTGAGDVFATALILAVRAGEDVAGRLAAACAAACVERPGSAPLPARTELETRAGLTPSTGDR
ncbi:MAG: PfkB family carbohydrate kinase [Chloroflexota bacterium]